MSKSCSICSNKSTLLWVVIIVIIVACVGALIWANRDKVAKDLGSIGGIPVTESTFSWDAKKGEIDTILRDAGFGRDLKPVDRVDISGDGVAEIFYETANKGEFVMLTENPANTPMLVQAYQKFADKEGKPFTFYKQDANADGVTKTYVADKMNFFIVQLEKSTGGKCSATAYRWEQVKRAMVLYPIAEEQKKSYCSQ